MRWGLACEALVNEDVALMFGCLSAGRASPASVRERLAPDRAAMSRLLAGPPPGIDELFLLSTCHRVELYATGPEPGLLDRMALALGADRGRDEVSTAIGSDAIAHLFRVTAGLESLVVGEPQIQAQVRRSLADARAHHAARNTLTAIVDRALRAGRRARSRTSLGAIGESIGTATARLLAERLDGLTGRRGVIVGAGAAAEDAATAVRARGAELSITSRTSSHAIALAMLLDADAEPLDRLDALLRDAAFAIVAVSGGELLTSLSGNTPILIDLSTPHAIAPMLQPITIDQLPAPAGALVERGVTEASEVIADEVAAMVRWIRTRQEPRWESLLEPWVEVRT